MHEASTNGSPKPSHNDIVRTEEQEQVEKEAEE